MRKESAMHRVAVLALPPVVAFDLTIATHVFGHDGQGRYATTVCSPDGGSVPTTTPGLDLTVQAALDALDGADTVIVPGFARGPAPARALDALAEAYRRGARVASICTGAFALAQAGLLDGRRATTHWVHAQALAREHPRVTVDANALYIDQDPVFTSAGLAAGLDLCLYLVGRDHGQSAAIQRARHMVTPLHRAGGQAQFIPAGAQGQDDELAAVTAWANANLHLPITVLDLARQGVVSTRTLHRTFRDRFGMSPQAWLTQQRLRAACALLENGQITVEEVARRTGLGTATNLRTHFHRAFATTPTAYRRAFTP
ncbi:helix-turn-helix domain-containing protein [Sphaerisporangium sp. TRM90804]|uniref:GlxA family transcriptional regulator n=1 Tax=Sphaerisporangium sp. TRM90804 TaxID=3031113 RepID=UPI0024474BF2|nr:helix-turn-helix domain-containing protein [Sphaerisporangium sp. TRM90804]MDH2426129.1 helix-turn-helix domain-containing protein [Sphaerisporangium sp. TRM90804]